VVSNPEFLAEGSAILNLEEPDRVLVGANTSLDDEDERDMLTTKEALKRVCDIYARWIPQERIITTNLWSSELAKLASNAFLAQRISSINAVSAMCEEVGAEVADISRVCRIQSSLS
jgi:UDPglucose 6-dehydrogenase